jgi:menaquinone-dependent protoporphyrinogen IX oxidase
VISTRVIATHIAAGLCDTYEVSLVSVANATPALIAGADLLVVGAPTHMHGLSTVSSRQAARKAAAKPDSGLTLDPDAGGSAMRY